MPLDLTGKEPGTKGYSFTGLTPQQKKQAAAIAISKAQQKHGLQPVNKKKKHVPPKTSAKKGSLPPWLNKGGQ